MDFSSFPFKLFFGITTVVILISIVVKLYLKKGYPNSEWIESLPIREIRGHLFVPLVMFSAVALVYVIPENPISRLLSPLFDDLYILVSGMILIFSYKLIKAMYKSWRK